MFPLCNVVALTKAVRGQPHPGELPSLSLAYDSTDSIELRLDEEDCVTPAPAEYSDPPARPTTGTESR